MSGETIFDVRTSFRYEKSRDTPIGQLQSANTALFVHYLHSDTGPNTCARDAASTTIYRNYMEYPYNRTGLYKCKSIKTNALFYTLLRCCNSLDLAPSKKSLVCINESMLSAYALLEQKEHLLFAKKATKCQ